MMHRTASRTWILLIGAWIVNTHPLAAQPAPDSLVQVYRQAVLMADSAGDRVAALEARMALAPWVKEREALPLLERAITLADSLDRPDMGAEAYRLLGERHAARGRYQQAYASLVQAAGLDDRREQRNEVYWEERLAAAEAQARVQRDSLVQRAGTREQTMGQAITELQRAVQLWMIVAAAVLLVGLLLILLLFYRAGRSTTRAHQAIAELKARLEEQPSASFAGPEVSPSPVDAAMEPVVDAIFRKQAPERLATLRAARQRGDAQKIRRVVASLKPQLLAFDAARFGPLISRLKAPGAAKETTPWNADLDALEAALEELLRG